MKKCALFFLCIFLLASCSKKDEASEVRTSEDYRLEVSIQQDVQQLKAVLVDFVSGRDMNELNTIISKLEDTNSLSDLDPVFATEDFQNLQMRLYSNMEIFSSTHHFAEVEQFGQKIAETSNKTRAKLYDGTPCYDAWDLTMGAATATFFVCIGYSPELLTKSRCVILYALAVAQAEATYKRCIQLSY